MQEVENNGIGFKSLSITILLSAIAGFLLSLWTVRLDPAGTGGSILMIPVIVVLFLLCISLFGVGLICSKDSFGKYLSGAALLIQVSFFISKEILLSAFN